MTAAVYARKSTDESGVCQKSVTRQLDHARQYAARKGRLPMNTSSLTMGSRARSLATGRDSCV
jgi:hypothetical protein